MQQRQKTEATSNQRDIRTLGIHKNIKYGNKFME